MALLTYPAFYRRFGVRTIAQVAAPPTTDLSLLNLPMSAVYHYVTYDGVELGPPSDDYLFRHITKPILVGHVLELAEDKGNPRKLGVNVQALVRDYHARHRRTRPLRSLEVADRDKTTLLVYNYCLLAKNQRYVRSFFTEYYKWYNQFSTVMQTLASVAALSERQQFLMLRVPAVIPSMQQLGMASGTINQATLKTLRGEDAYVFLELWKWLSAERASSLFSKIPANKLQQINLVYQESAKWCTINLGVLNSFRDNKDDPLLAEYLTPAKQVIDATQLQKRVVRMLMTLMEVRTLTANAGEDAELGVGAPTPSKLAQKLSTDTDEDELGERASEFTDVPGQNTGFEDEEDQALNLPQEQAALATVDADIQLDEDDEGAQARILAEDAQLDEDLAQLNEIARRQESQTSEDEAPLAEVILEAKDTSLEDGILFVCDRLADDGLLSAAEYRRFTKLANAYKSLSAPDGKSTLEEFIKIPPEVLKITGSSSVPDSTSVLDKTMLKSSLLDFDQRYIEQVMAKDTAAFVLNVQKAGVAVTGYKVERVDDVLGGYEMHSLRLAPVVGVPSTLRFKLPIVQADGTYSSNGVRYRLRKQRGD
jgi:uncharacterized protein YfcZ (UPF0381/DUF406 family)